MITWATTVAPQTESSFVQGYYSIRRQNPGGGASITLTQDFGTTSWQNWSRTTGSSSFSAAAHTGGSGLSSDSFVSILGTTNSTTFKVSTNSNGVPISHEYGYTLRFVLNATSTQTTREYTYRATGTSESSFSYPVTTEFDGQTFTTASEESAATITTTAVGTTQESCISTTTAADTICTPILATVVVADKNEVIWAVNSIAATGMSGLIAATALGTTATRTTIMPWTQTIVAAQGKSTQTTAITLPLISQSLTYASLQYTQTEIATVTDYSVLPHPTVTTMFSRTFTTESSNLSYTIFDEETITATVSELSETIFTTTPTSMPITEHQSELTTITFGTTTHTRKATYPYAETSTSSTTYEIFAFSGPELTDTYTWQGIGLYTTSNNLTTFAKMPQRAKVVEPQQVGMYRDFYGGVYNNGSVANGYSCPPLGLVYDIFPEVSRGVSSIMPTVTNYQTTFVTTIQGEDEEGEPYSLTAQQATNAGTITVSGFSVTVQPSSATGTNSTATDSFELQPFGSGVMLIGEPMKTMSAINGASLGASESVYQKFNAGVYSLGTSTFSTSGGCRSWEAGGDPQAVPIGLSYIEAGTERNGASPIWWTVSRNSHPHITALTRASAYSAP